MSNTIDSNDNVSGSTTIIRLHNMRSVYITA